MTLSEFIKNKAKTLGMKVVDIAECINLSHGSLYRYMRGIRVIPNEIAEALCFVLKLNESEKHEFYRLIEQSSSQKPMIRAFNVLDSFIFDGLLVTEQAEKGEDVHLLDGERYLISPEKLYERILRHAGEPGFTCNVKIIDGIGEPYLRRLANFIERVNLRTRNATIEHLISFPTKNYEKCMQTFIEVLPFLKHENYHLYYKDSDFEANKVFLHSIYISTLFQGKNNRPEAEYFLISSRKHSRKECICTTNPLMHEFLTNDFFDLRQDYKNSFQDFSVYGQNLDFVMKAEEKNAMACVKQNIHFGHMSGEVFSMLLERLSLEERQEIAIGLTGENVSSDKLDYVIENLRKAVLRRYLNTKKHPQTVICSKAGLEEMVKTGRLGDHLSWLPSFRKDEVRMILEDICNRNEDENEDFNLYIVDKPILENEHIITVYGTSGVSIQFNHKEQHQGMNKYLYIENMTIANVFHEYMNSYIPLNFSISKKETFRYLSKLIKACQ